MSSLAAAQLQVHVLTGVAKASVYGYTPPLQGRDIRLWHGAESRSDAKVEGLNK